MLYLPAGKDCHKVVPILQSMVTFIQHGHKALLSYVAQDYNIIQITYIHIDD
jgi:hypothetical protein